MEAGLNPRVVLHRLDVKQMLMVKEEAPDDQSPCADLGDLKHQNMKKEQEEVCISLGGELLVGGKDTDAIRFPVPATVIKNEDDEQSLLLLMLYPDRIQGTEIPQEDKGESKIEANGDDCNVLKTEKVEDEEEYSVKHPPSVMKHVSDSGLKIKPMDCDWNESKAPGSDKKFKQFIHDYSLQKNMILSDTESSISQSNEQCFTEKDNVESQKTVQTEMMFYCVDCGKTFISKQSLKVHQRIHTGKKPYCCNLCNKRFAYNTSLKNHILSHTGEKPFSCDLCNKRFSEKCRLNRHMIIHTGQKPFSCALCQKTFSDKSNLNAHKKIHTGQKPFRCDLCSKEFCRKSHLNEHMRIHTGLKLFCCNLCNKGFVHKASLKSHIISHTGKKPFSCDLCDKHFGTKSHLNRHMTIHT